MAYKLIPASADCTPILCLPQRHDLTQAQLPEALAHEARRALGDRVACSPEAAAAFEHALVAALDASGLPEARGATAQACQQAEYYSTLGIDEEARTKAANRDAIIG